MVFGLWTTPQGAKALGAADRHAERARAACAWACAVCTALLGLTVAVAQACTTPVYLTFDTGHMGVAPLIAEVLKRQQVRVTFFAANERAQTGESSLAVAWRPWWRARADEGHEFASHTFDHVYWRGDFVGDGVGASTRFKIRPSTGPLDGREQVWTAAQYCAEIQRSTDRLAELTGRKPLPLFRAPGGKTSPQLLTAAKSCGYAHVGWAAAGFLGDELSVDQASNAQLLAKALKTVRAGDIMMAHLGIWSRQDPWAPVVLEPLIMGLKAKGFCFETLRTHPAYRDWIAKSSIAPPLAPGR